MNTSSFMTFLASLVIGFFFGQSHTVHAADPLIPDKVLQTLPPDKGLLMIESLLESDEASLKPAQKGQLYLQQGHIHNKRLSNKDKALVSYYKALTHFRNAGDETKQYVVLSYLGVTHNSLYRYDYAMEYFKGIFSLQLEDEVKKLYASYLIAKTHRLMESYDSAIFLQKQLVEEFKTRGMLVDEMDSHLEMGLSYVGLEQWDKAMESYRLVIALAGKDASFNRIRAKSYDSQGFIYLKQEQYEKAKACFQKAMPLMVEENDPRMLIVLYNNLGLLALTQSSVNEAISYFKMSVEFHPNETDILELEDAFNELIAIYKDRRETGLALIYSQRLNEILSHFAEQSKELEILHKQYMAETVQQAIERFELKEAMIRQRHRNTIIITVLACLLVFSSGLYFRKVYTVKMRKKRMKERVDYLINVKYAGRI